MSAQNEPRIRALVERINKLGGTPSRACVNPDYIRMHPDVVERLLDLGLVQWSDDFSELVLR